MNSQSTTPVTVCLDKDIVGAEIIAIEPERTTAVFLGYLVLQLAKKTTRDILLSAVGLICNCIIALTLEMEGLLTSNLFEIVCCIVETRSAKDVVGNIRELGKSTHIESERSFVHSPFTQIVLSDSSDKGKCRLRQLEQDLRHAEICSPQDRPGGIWV